MRLWPHFHRDPSWQEVGVHRYHQCQCGARRVERATLNLAGPTASDWPPMVDRHGRYVDHSGWESPPPEGWRTTGYPGHRPAPVRPCPPSPPKTPTKGAVGGQGDAPRTPPPAQPKPATIRKGTGGDYSHLIPDVPPEVDPELFRTPTRGQSVSRRPDGPVTH